MDNETKNLIINFYKQNFSLREIECLIKRKYGREIIRKELKKVGIILRGRGMVYKDHKRFSSEESAFFAEFLGYFYGDGSLHKYKNTSHGLYECHLSFGLNEKDLVDKIVDITKKLFQFRPKIIKKKSHYIIKFRRSFGKYLNNLEYPAGKKSKINPYLPFNILRNDLMKKSFICGFLNAEATVNKGIAVQQSIRVVLSQEKINFLKQKNKAYYKNELKCYFIKWNKVKSLLDSKIKKSNILFGLKTILDNFKIPSRLYPIRLYIGKENKTSIHFELRINPKFVRKIINFKMLSCKKKVEKLKHLMRECRSGQTG